MSRIFQQVLDLIARGEVRVSAHGYDELEEDGILVSDVVSTTPAAVVVEEYPDYPKGPCVLVLQNAAQDRPIHVLWGIPKGKTSPAVLVTAYRPDPSQWTDGFMRRKP